MVHSGDGSRSVWAADFDRDGDLDVLSTHELNDKVLLHVNNGSGSFNLTRTVSTAADGPFFASAADVDGDGDLDVLSDSNTDSEIAWYENDGVGIFGAQRIVSTAAFNPRSVVGADLDGDGDVDLLTAALADRISWHRNETVHRSAHFPVDSLLTTTANTAHAVAPADIDGDGDLDLVALSRFDNTVAWYENVNGLGTFGTAQVISTSVQGGLGLLASDIDGDGDVDVVASEFVFGTDDIFWFENTDGSGTFGATHLVSSAVQEPTAITAADLDEDGDPDILTSSGSFGSPEGVSWLENTDGAGTFGDPQTIGTTTFAPGDLVAADLDGNGDLDVLVQTTVGVFWFENLGSGSWSSAQEIGDLFGASSALAEDVDGDGDLDAISGSATNSINNTIVWYKNVGPDDGSGPCGAPISACFSSAQSIAVASSRSLFAADLDLDGDLDLVSASSINDELHWLENTDSVGTFASPALVSEQLDFVAAVAADLDGDGDPDIASAASGQNTFAWHENRGGQFALPTTSVAQNVVADSQELVLFRIDFEHRGRADDSAVELATVELRFEDGAKFFPSLLTSSEADALIERLDLFLDDGSGSFEPGPDTLVAQVGSFDLTDGVETVALTTGDPLAQVGFGTSKSYFVVAIMTTDASGQTPNAFEAFHQTASSSTARDASVPTVPLTLELEADAFTGRIDTDINSAGATCSAPFELNLEGFTVTATVVCEAGTVLTAGDGLSVEAPGDLTLRAGEGVELGSDFAVASGAVLEVDIDSGLKP